ncbi:MAG TPA: MATE family efflux transporter [Caulobacteraceae bacterium]|nr:MATE family efflux transporter [Caulobacteraceae bacterium]
MDAAGAPAAAAPARPAPTHRRTGRDLTQGPITRTLLLFSLPLMAGNALQSLSLTVNQIWVSHLLGEAAITSLGNANIVMMLMLGAVFGVGMAANILVAQAVGARDFPLVKQVMGTTTVFFVLLSVTLAAAGVLLSPRILDLMGTPPEARHGAIVYLRVSFGAVPFMYFFMFMQMAQRGAGDSITPFWFLALSLIIDITLNPLLIRGIGPFPKLGIAGSATSTLVGQGTALIFLMAHLYRKNSVLVLRRGEFRLLRPNLDIFRSIVTRGIPMGLQMLVMSGTAAVMLGFVNRYGYLTAAAYSISSMIWSYLQMPTMAIGASVSSMAGQNVGAGMWDRVGQVARSGVMSGLVVTGTLAVLLYLFNDQVLGILLPSGSPAIPLAHHINTTVLWGFVIFSVTFSLTGVIRSTGDVRAPLLILVVSMLVVRIPFAAAMSRVIGEDAIWWSFPLGTISSAALTALYYRYGPWRRARMLDDTPLGTAGDAGLATPAVQPREPGAPPAAALATRS